MSDKKKRINNLINFIEENFSAEHDMDDGELQRKVKEILGFDKQCFKCLVFYTDDEVVRVEGTDKFVCDDCAEQILSGQKDVFEHEL